MSDQTGGLCIAEYDWLIDYTEESGRTSPRLHAPNLLIVVHYQSWWDEGENYGEVHGPAPALCGTYGEWSIPGAGSRMGVPRCRECCRLSGIPDGIGSPKNDEACRSVLGMPAGEDK